MIYKHIINIILLTLLSATLAACAGPSGGGSSSAPSPGNVTAPTDTDGDGIADAEDNCPTVRNRDQADGDDDDVGNACDNCPMVANANQVNTDRMGEGNATRLGDLCDVDIDGDGVNNTVDNCPGISNPEQSNLYGPLDNDSGDVCDDLDGDAVGVTTTTYDSNLSDANLTAVTAITGGSNFDANDNCVGVANADQSNMHSNMTTDDMDIIRMGPGDACEDSDGDGASGALVFSTVTIGLDTTSYVNETSNFAAALVDAIDNCPRNVNPDQKDLDGDGRVGGGDVCDDETTISNEGNLTLMIRDHAGVKYRLTTDLNLTSWNEHLDFQGTFDGDGHTINLATVAAQFFKRIKQNATVMDVGILNGILATTNNGTIERAYATGDHHNATSSVATSGGLVLTNNYIIRNSYATGNVISNTTGTNIAYSGGLVGRNRGNISASYATGHVSATNASAGNSYSGGLVGWSENGWIFDSYATGDSFSNGSASGGLVGHVESGMVNRTYAVGNATGSDYLGMNIGGLIGSSTLAVSNYLDSYRLEGSGDSTNPLGVNRTLSQLQCPESANATCEGETTYEVWDDAIWNFGDNETLPTLERNIVD